MTHSPRLELVSFKLCPYVQRSVITLLHKQAPFEITYIDLDEPPAWFDQISPLGQVPLLKVGDKGRETVLFESAVINEYLDETVGQPMHPRDPLAKARERAWIEYTSELFRQNYLLTMEKDPAELPALKDEFFTDLARLDQAFSSDGPHFRGPGPSLVDAAIAPLWMRVALTPGLADDPRWKDLARVQRSWDALSRLSEVRDSVVPEFKQLYLDYVRGKGGALFSAK